MRPWSLLLLLGCRHDLAPVDDADDTEAADAEPVDSDVAPTETDAAPVDSEVDDGPPDPAVDTATPLAEAEDGPYRGRWAPRGGTRLVAVHVLHEGAAEPAFSHFHDTLLDLDCAFAVAEDGRLRCLPDVGGHVWDQDATCSETGSVLPSTCGERRHGRRRRASSCGPESVFVDALAPDPSVRASGHVDSYSQRCVTEPLPDGSVFARAVGSVPPSHFVRGVARRTPAGDDLDVVVVRANDGAVAPLGLFDPARGALCTPAYFAADPPDTFRCTPWTDVVPWPYPYATAWRQTYDDDTCAVVTAVAARADCDDDTPPDSLDPTTWEFRAFVEEPPIWTYDQLRELGAVVTEAYALTGTPPVCEAVDVSTERPFDSYRFRTLLDLVEPATLPRLARVGVGGGAVQVNAWVDGEGRALRPVSGRPFVDADGIPCAPTWDEDLATVRCVPHRYSATYTGWYADSCRTPLVDGSTGLRPGDVSLFTTWDAEDCFGPHRIGRTGPGVVVGEPLEVDTPLWAYEASGSCGAYSLVGAGRMLYRVASDPRPVSSWPRLTLDR